MEEKFKDLKIVQTIKSSTNLTTNQKKDVLSRLRRIYKSETERERCRFINKTHLNMAFVWSETEDGYEYWAGIHEQSIYSPPKSKKVLIDQDELVEELVDYLRNTVASTQQTVGYFECVVAGYILKSLYNYSILQKDKKQAPI